MLAARPNKIRIPLEVSIIIGLFACYLCAYVDGFIEQAVCTPASADVEGNRTCRRSIRPRYVLLSRDDIGPFRSRRVALAHPAEAECRGEPRGELATQPSYQHVLPYR